MTDATWGDFLRLPLAPRCRLMAAMKSIAVHGVADVPGRAFRWVGRSGASPQLAELEAHGVVLTGHVSPIEDRQQFFVTKITVDEAEEEDVPLRRSKAIDDRQGKLKFDNLVAEPSNWHGEPK